MEEETKKAFDFAADCTKQLITLSTAILTLTITFGKDVLQSVDAGTRESLTFSWVIYLVSIAFGIMTLLALTGTLDPIRKRKKPTVTAEEDVDPAAKAEAATAAAAQPNLVPTIQGLNIRILSILQIITFIVATGLVVRTGIRALSPSGSAGATVNVEQVVRDKQRQLVEALLRRDVAAIEQHLAADCVLGNLGQVMNRTQLTSALNSGELTWEDINLDDVRISVYGDTAIDSGHAVVKWKYKDQELSGKFRFSAVFVKRQDVWQTVSVQAARVDQP